MTDFDLTQITNDNDSSAFTTIEMVLCSVMLAPFLVGALGLLENFPDFFNNKGIDSL